MGTDNEVQKLRRAAAWSLVIVVMLIGLAISLTRSASADPSIASAAPPPQSVTAGDSRFGVAAGGIIQWASDRDVARELDGLVALGVGWIRFDLKWVVIEARKGRFDWKLHDRVVRMARARGLRVLATIAYSPPWARAPGTDEKGAPVNVADYARFAAAAVKRYAPLGVLDYEIWNEPNIVDFWKPQPDPAKYTELLKAAYVAMKKVNPSISVLTGGLSPAGGYNDPLCRDGSSVSADSINPINFLEAMYASGAGGYFDALADHPYTSPLSPFDTHRCNAWNQLTGTSPSLRSVMEANGDGAKRIWATEYGSPATSGEAEQARLLQEALELWPTYEWSGPLLYYAYKDALESYNLVRPDWSPRAAWFVYRDGTADSASLPAPSAARAMSTGARG
jgi:polysaccharide biosynthesis protein PslG